MNIISNRLLHDWLQVVAVKGHDLRPLLKASGIPLNRYSGTRSHINGQQLARLNSEIRRLLDDQFMGYGHDVMSPALLDRVMIKILAQAKNLKQIFCEWESFWNLVQRHTGLTSTSEDENEFFYRFQFNAPQRPGTYVWIFDSTMLKLQLFSWMIGKQIKPKVIGIAEAAREGISDDLALLPARVLFDQPYNFFTIDKRYLSYPVVRTLEQCLNYKQHLPRDFFVVPSDQRCFAGLVERTMRNMLRAEFRVPPIDWVARDLSVSVRGLNRRLETEGVSFQKLKNDIRRDLAMDKLTCPAIPIRSIAADLGFSGTAAFSRAFKAWTASTPQEYRTRNATMDHQS
jgi:AraC-like DNA-binding protein